MFLRDQLVFGLFPFFLVSIIFPNNKAVFAEENGAKLHKYRQDNFIQGYVLSPLSGGSLRRQKRGITDMDPGNRATEMPPEATPQTPPPPSTSPGVSKDATTAVTTAATNKTTKTKSLEQIIKELKEKLGCIRGDVSNFSTINILADTGSVTVFQTFKPHIKAAIAL